MPSSRLTILFQRWFDKTASPAEADEFLQLLSQASDEEMEELMDESWDVFESTRQLISAARSEAILQTALSVSSSQAPVRKMGWKKWVAAASIIVLLGAGLLWWTNRNTTSDAPPIAEDVQAPDRSKATITLADGRSVSIDSLTTLSQGNVDLVKLADGRIVYTGANTNVAYNTLANPRGSKVIDMTLADGSRVWLNAGSSVTYPIAFVGNSREVQIRGEAYFEISHDKTKPFVVSKDKTSITVLGTHFNVNAYDDESTIKVTLLEGSVRVNSTTIKPNEQAVVTGNSVVTNMNVDIEQVMAWKNGLFQFSNTSVEEIMRQVSRWYDVEVVFEDRITERLNGTIPRTVSVNNVFKILELTGKVRFRVEGRKVVVSAP